jgi:1-acyl-sn-glycerol-3-phosphate acyltransferase
VEFLPPLPQGLEKADFMARMEATIEGRTNELIAMARGEPVKPSVLVEWNGRKNVATSPTEAATANLLP